MTDARNDIFEGIGKRISVAVVATLLAGCAHKEPAIEVRTVEVPVLRVEKCINRKDMPAKPGPLPKPRPKNISSALDVAIAKILELQTYADKADAVLKGCAG